MGKNIPTEGPSVDRINEGTQIVGEIKTQSDILINGVLKGNVHCKGKVLVGTSGKIIGDVYSRNATVSGNIEGKLEVTDQTTLKSTAVVKGEIITGKLEVETGALLNVACRMDGSKPGMNPDAKKGK